MLQNDTSTSKWPWITPGRARVASHERDAAVVCEAALLTAPQDAAGTDAAAVPRNPLAYVAPDMRLNERLLHGEVTNTAIRDAHDRALQLPPSILSAEPDAGTAGASLLWTDRWRPTRAAHVLGNESQAEYMRNWLRQHRLSYKDDPLYKKRVIQTRIAQRKRRGRPPKTDEFDSDEEAWFEQFRESASSAGASDDRVTNCILLTGATGVGKSAAVYACAAELDFDVFEIYPGMCRRNGKELAAAVGQLGRNHMVAHEHENKQKTPRQSLILLDEVDVLFDEDIGFWPAVIELIGESRRPVVLTCTGMLPLEPILTSEMPQQCPCTIFPSRRSCISLRHPSRWVLYTLVWWR